MRIVVVGAGGVGGYFGAKLANAGNDVTFIARGQHLEAMKNNGLVVKSINGDLVVNQFNATNQISEIVQPELVIVAVKAWQVKDVAKELQEVIGKETMILPLQNGVLAAEELSEILGKEKVVGGLCRIFSKIEAPGIIQHFGVKPTIVMGELSNARTARVEKLKQLFDEAGINCKIADDISVELWKKFIAICVSGLLAVTRTTYGELRELPETRQMMIDLLDEVYLVGKAAGVNIPEGFIDKTVSFIDTFPYETTSSLTRDVLEGKPSEIEYQNGSVVLLGERFGVETPINKFVYHSILPMEMKARGGQVK